MAEHFLASIRVQVAEGMDADRAIERLMPEASRAHRVDRWLRRWLEIMRDRTAMGERSPSYLRELERWAKPQGHFDWWRGKSIYEIRAGALGLDSAGRGAPALDRVAARPHLEGGDAAPAHRALPEPVGAQSGEALDRQRPAEGVEPGRGHGGRAGSHVRGHEALERHRMARAGVLAADDPAHAAPRRRALDGALREAGRPGPRRRDPTEGAEAFAEGKCGSAVDPGRFGVRKPLDRRRNLAGRTGLEPATFVAALPCFRALGETIAEESWYLGGTWSERVGGSRPRAVRSRLAVLSESSRSARRSWTPGTPRSRSA